jgi:hypothetical protein
LQQHYYYQEDADQSVNQQNSNIHHRLLSSGNI